MRARARVWARVGIRVRIRVKLRVRIRVRLYCYVLVFRLLSPSRLTLYLNVKAVLLTYSSSSMLKDEVEEAEASVVEI